MKYFKQFGWIMIVTCIGEIMKYYIPFQFQQASMDLS